MTTYNVRTNLDPETLTAVAAETFRLWLAFALGGLSLGGQTLAHPSGRYAASMSWRKTGTASVAIIADETIAPEAEWIEDGNTSADMKAAMLGGPGTKTSKAGYQYRAVPIRKDGAIPPITASIDIMGSSASGEKLPGRLWRSRAVSNPDHFAMMSDKPGSSAWIRPAMPAYSPAAILKDLLDAEYGA